MNIPLVMKLFTLSQVSFKFRPLKKNIVEIRTFQYDIFSLRYLYLLFQTVPLLIPTTGPVLIPLFVLGVCSC